MLRILFSSRYVSSNERIEATSSFVAEVRPTKVTVQIENLLKGIVLELALGGDAPFALSPSICLVHMHHVPKMYAGLVKRLKYDGAAGREEHADETLVDRGMDVGFYVAAAAANVGGVVLGWRDHRRPSGNRLRWRGGGLGLTRQRRGRQDFSVSRRAAVQRYLVQRAFSSKT
jgi:hypothetical protein